MAEHHTFYVAATRLSCPNPSGCRCCGADSIVSSNTNGDHRELCASCAHATLQALIDIAPPPKEVDRG